MPTADKGLLTLIRKELAPVMQWTLGNAQLARHLRLRFSTPVEQLHRFQFEFLSKGPLLLWHAALPLETLFQVYLLRKCQSMPLPALVRLGNGLSRRKIAIFAKGNNLNFLTNLLVDTKLFNKKNLIDVSSSGDFGRAERATVFLVFWDDWQDKIDEILRAKKDNTALVVYAPPGAIPRDKLVELDNKRNVTVTNFRGRLLNDIVVSMITTSYQKDRN